GDETRRVTGTSREWPQPDWISDAVGEKRPVDLQWTPHGRDVERHRSRTFGDERPRQDNMREPNRLCLVVQRHRCEPTLTRRHTRSEVLSAMYENRRSRCTDGPISARDVAPAIDGRCEPRRGIVGMLNKDRRRRRRLAEARHVTIGVR